MLFRTTAGRTLLVRTKNVRRWPWTTHLTLGRRFCSQTAATTTMTTSSSRTMCVSTDLPLNADSPQVSNSTNMAPSTTTTSSSSSSATTTWIPANHQRSAREIQTLVQLRVHERETTFTVNGVVESAVPPFRTTAKFFLTSLPKYFLFRPPSQKQLDEEFPVRPMNWNQLKQQQQQQTGITNNTNTNDDIQITWLGHASLLVQMGGLNILTDPVFSDRCSPAQWFGPQRYRPPPCTMAELCENLDIHLVLISHNHYDHLDYNTVRDIAKLAPQAQFVVPLGLQAWMRLNIGSQLRIFELDWHETSRIWVDNNNKINNNDKITSKVPVVDSGSSAAVSVTAVPMRHWSNRTGDRDKTLWCGYRVQTVVDHTPSSNNANVVPTQKSFLFSGDTAWFDGLQDMVGARYGPFDVAAIPIGAYEPRDFMRHAHIDVAEAVAMKTAVRARHAVPIHWGTFPLTTEPVMEPREKLKQLMGEDDDTTTTTTFAPWLIGETKRF